MDPRDTWQALQARLRNARAAVEAGDRGRALAEIGAALDIDPDFLAAQSLRERILAAPDVAPPAPAVRSASAGSALSEPANPALESGRLTAAATALDEVIERDPTPPEMRELTAKLPALRRADAQIRRGPRLVAASVFAASLLGASLLHDSTSLISRPMIAAAPLVSAQMPSVTSWPEPTEVGTTGDSETGAEPAVPPVVPVPDMSNAHPVVVSAIATLLAEATEVVAPELPAVVPAPRLIASVEELAVVAPVSTPMPPAAAIVDDSLLVQQALQRYRTAYEGLDAQSAQAVWPAVNQAALARAFDALESQSLTFDACDVRVLGESATATCQGSARYVPKVGSREPRIEPRVWNFSLHKTGDDWKIENARAER